MDNNEKTFCTGGVKLAPPKAIPSHVESLSLGSKVLVVYESLSGNTKTFVDFIVKAYPNVNFIIKNTKDDLTNLGEYDKIIIGTYTWSNGKIPKNIKSFVISNRDVLINKPVLLFGSGITIYTHFCGALDNIQIILEKDIPKIKFELTFIPEEHKEDLEMFNNFIKE